MTYASLPRRNASATRPGISLITVSPQAWAAIERNPLAPRDSFLSLLDWRDHWHGKGRFPYTPSVSDIYGIETACDLFLEEGRDAVFARHESAARVRRAGVVAMGLRLWPAPRPSCRPASPP